MKTLRRSIVSLARSACYATGLLGGLHRLRNRRTLTVFMFHRVLPANSLEYANADREFTFSVDGFDRTLDFIKRHYRIVDIEAVRGARSGVQPLPPNAGLITFDDGWSDTLDYALPVLEKHGLPALLFMTAELLDDDATRWWQDAVVEIQSEPGSRAALAERLGLDPEAPHLPWRLSTAVAALTSSERKQLLAEWTAMDLGCAQMLRAGDLPRARAGRMAVGAHGYSHAPLSLLAQDDAERELQLSYARIVAAGGSATMAFPHGACTPQLIAKAHACGFDLVFSSEAALNANIDRAALARLHIPENEWTCRNGGISPAMLATYLFFRPLAT